VNQPLKWHGGKRYLAHQIVARMPPHTHYVEPYAGGLAVLLAKPSEGVSEVVNDLNAGQTNFWRVLQDTARFRQFRRRVEAVPFSEAEWQHAAALLDKMSRSSRPDVERAVRFFVRCRQSQAGRCQTLATTPLWHGPGPAPCLSQPGRSPEGCVSPALRAGPWPARAGGVQCHAERATRLEGCQSGPWRGPDFLH
jgi:hypothetical protein